jgi:hypothetical protein
MRRTNRRHSRAIERHRRNKGPELFSLAADHELKEKAAKLAEGLSTAAIKNGSAAAASLLIELAEGAQYPENLGALERAFSLADKWASEPQMVPLDIVRPILKKPSQQLQLGDGSEGSGSDESDDILDAEFETEPEGESGDSRTSGPPGAKPI